MTSGIYHQLSQWKWLKNSYSLKFLFITFVGIHVPLIASVVAIVFELIALNSLQIIGLVLLATLVSTGFTLLILKGLVSPVIHAKDQLTAYTKSRKITSLPTTYTDELGILLRITQQCIEQNEAFLEENEYLAGYLVEDFRAPLGKALLLTDLIRNEEDKEQREFYVSALTDRLQKQLLSIGDAVKSIQAEGYNLEEESTVELTSLLRQVLHAKSEPLQEKDIQVDFTNPDHVMQKGNEGMLRLAFENLMDFMVNEAALFSAIQIKIKAYSFENQVLLLGTSKTEPDRKEPNLFLARKLFHLHGGHISFNQNNEQFEIQVNFRPIPTVA